MVLMNSVCTVFRVHYRTQFGDSISIRGSHQGLSWHTGLEASWDSVHHEDDVWVLTLPVRNGGEDSLIHFKPLINDEDWAKGSDYVVRPGEVIDVFPFFFTSKGSRFSIMFESKILKNKRKVSIYLPPSYHENPLKRYPVILFQDGHNLFDPADSFCGDTWELTRAMDLLCSRGGIQEYIVVGIYPVEREFEYLPTVCGGEGGGADMYLDSLALELCPMIENLLRTIPGSYAIAGSSYGGVISLYAWVTRPHMFDICGAFSPSMKYDNKVLIDIVKQRLEDRPESHKLYMDCGTIKDERKAVLETVDYLVRESPLDEEQFLFILAEGHAHTERHWAMRAPTALAWMFADANRSQSYRQTCEDNEMGLDSPNLSSSMTSSSPSSISSSLSSSMSFMSL